MDPTGSAMCSAEDGTMVGDSATLTWENDDTSLMKLLAGTQEDRVDSGSGVTGCRMTTSPNSRDWEAYRAIITHYYKHYKGRGLPLRAVRSIMDLRYGFIAR
jgi:Clr5 domain